MPSFRRRTKHNLVILFILILLVVYVLKIQKVYQSSEPISFIGFNNVTGDKNLIVPNIIHYVQFDQKDFSFLPFICICSAFYNHKPSRIYLHTNVGLQGKYFQLLRRVLAERLEVRALEKPSHVFGQKLSSVEHSADVARIKILMKYGGIFLDQDVFVVKNLNRFRHFELAVGWPEGQNIGSQVILAHRDARFLPLYLAEYQNYRANSWYYNAGEAPTNNILSSRPHLVHRVELQFGVENLSWRLYRENWAGWTGRHTIHLLHRHQDYLTNTTTTLLTELNYKDCHCTVGTMIESIITEMEEDGISITDEDLEAEVVTFLSKAGGSLLHKFLSRELYVTLKNERTQIYKTGIRDVIRSGLSHPDSNIGVYAPDVESYVVFERLFNPIIKSYHKISGRIYQPPSDWRDHAKRIGSFDDKNKRVISTRIRIARSLQGFPLNSRMTADDYVRLERKVRPVLESLTGDLAGEYRSLSEMTESEHEKLVSEHLMFAQCDSYLVDAGACQHWPTGRGLFLNQDRTFVVWVGEEDHLRIISIEQGGNLGSVFSRLAGAVEILSEALHFVHDDSLGHVTFCPSNLGTTLRASVHVTLPNLASRALLESLATKSNLQVRGTGGEHTESVGGIVDISNSKRLGDTEVDIVAEMYEAVTQLIMKEESFN